MAYLGIVHGICRWLTQHPDCTRESTGCASHCNLSIDKVLNATIADVRIEYLVQFEVFGIIHDDGVRGW